MVKRLFLITFAAASLAGAIGITDWLSINGSNQVIYARQKENGYRWTWDILQTEVWAWRFAVGAEGEIDQPRPAIYDTGTDYKGYRLVQRYGRYRDNIFDVRAGTFDKTLGKGLTLRAYNDRASDIWKVLDGGAASTCLNFGGRQWGSVQALWGENRYRREDVMTHPEHKLYDEVKGAEVTFKPFDFIYVTGSGVQAEIEHANPPATRIKGRMLPEKLVGGGLGGGWRCFDAYAEYAQREGFDFAHAFLKEDQKRTGEGLYAVANGYLPRSSISAEYKRYVDFWYPYSSPPACSVDDEMIIGNLTSPYPTEWGYFAKGTANPIDPIRLSAGYSYADDKVGDTDFKSIEIKEYFGTVRYDTPIDLVAEVGYEHLGNIIFYEFGGKGNKVRDIPSLQLSWSPWADHSFMVEGEHEWRYNYNAVKEYQDNRYSLGYTYSSWLGFTGSYEDTDEDVTEVYPDPEGEKTLSRQKQNWLWGEVRLSWFNKYARNQVLTVGYGARRGGEVCSGGSCREELAFNGLKVNLESTF